MKNLSLSIVTLACITLFTSCEKETDYGAEELGIGVLSDCVDMCSNGTAIPSESEEVEFCECQCDEGFYGDLCQISGDTIYWPQPDEGRQCPEWIQGDDELGDQAQIEVDISYSVVDGTMIRRTVFMRVQGIDDPDNSMAESTWESIIYTAADNLSIGEILSPDPITLDYVDEDTQTETETFENPNSPVEELDIKGVTTGSDLGNNCAGNKAHIKVKYNPLIFTVYED